jgi:hypothetical protein
VGFAVSGAAEAQDIGPSPSSSRQRAEFPILCWFSRVKRASYAASPSPCTPAIINSCGTKVDMETGTKVDMETGTKVDMETGTKVDMETGTKVDREFCSMSLNPKP